MQESTLMLQLFAEPAFQRHLFLFLPPYSPVLNPIENAFSCIKAHAKRELALLRERLMEIETLPRGQKIGAKLDLISQVVHHSLPEVTELKAARWYSHCLEYLPASLNHEDIVD